MSEMVDRGVARIFEWGDERQRRDKRGAEGAEGGRVRGGGVPLPAGEGVWGGGCDPSPEKMQFLHQNHTSVMHSDTLLK